MRISDWSSDVCSSDLAGHGGAVAFDVDLGAQAHQFLHVHEAVLEDRLVDDADAFGDAVHGHELRLHVGGETRMRRGDDVHRLRPAPAHRSEEHTSELQSLMRISYAVFCLKKKNKTND